MTKTKEPQAAIAVEIISLGPRKVVQAVPEGNKVTIGEDCYEVRHDDVFAGAKGKPTAIVVKGRGRALTPWSEEPAEVTSRQLDTTAHNNLLDQLNSIAKNNEKKAGASIGVIIGLCALALIVIGGMVHLSGKVGDLDDKLGRTHQPTGVYDGATAGAQQQPPPQQTGQQGCLVGSPGCPTGG